ncbi:Multidrug resistance-associated protein 1, partial [Fragariocoptes setiger]
MDHDQQPNRHTPTPSESSQRLYVVPEHLHTLDDFKRDQLKQKDRIATLLGIVNSHASHPVFVTLFLPPYQAPSSRKTIERNCYNTFRCTILVFTILLRLLECGDHIYVAFFAKAGGTGYSLAPATSHLKHRIFAMDGPHGREPPLVISAFAAPIIQTFGLSLLLFLYESHRKRGIHSASITWFFLLFNSLFGLPDFYDIVKDANAAFADGIDFVARVSSYLLIVLLFLIDCYGDRPNPNSIYGDPTDPRPICPEVTASYLSRMTFWWFNGFLWRGFKRPITPASLWQTQPQDQAQTMTYEFERLWLRGKNKKKFYLSNSGLRRHHNHIALVVAKLFGGKFIIAGLFKLIQDTLQFITPIFLKRLLRFMSSATEPAWHGYLFGIGLLVIPTIQSLILGAYFHRMVRIGMQVRSLLISSVYRKSLLLGSSSRQDSTTGEIVNLMAVDAQRFQDLMMYVNLLWSAPFQIGVSIYLLHNELGWPVFAGVAIMALVVPFNTFVSNRMKRNQVFLMKTKDERIKQMSEILSGIKVLKLYAWENSFLQNIIAIREKELKFLRKILNFDALTVFGWQCSPFLVALVTFVVYVSVDVNNVLDSEKAFVSISLFNLLRFPMTMLPQMITSLVMTMVSVQRLNKFLNNDELLRYVTHNETLQAICVEDGSVTWTHPALSIKHNAQTANGSSKLSSTELSDSEHKPKPTLRDINLSVKRGQFITIVGQVASGKTSLLSSLLGEMHHIRGRFNISGSLKIAYVPQQAWIQNMSIRDNILFGRPFDATRYDQVMRACALYTDILTLPAGDASEIGEKGINLSGGQKQRVSLARACYSDADIYLLDDPLSAVDSHVAKHLYEQVLSSTTGLLANKTRLLVTNSLFVLPYVDKIVVMVDGKITETGTYNQLTSVDNGAFAEFIRQYNSRSDEQDNKHGEMVETEDQALESQPMSESMKAIKVGAGADKLIETEHSETGKVRFSIYLYYFRSASFFWVTVVLLSLITANALNVGSNFWLSEWASDSEHADTRYDIGLRNLRMAGYGILGGLQALCILLASLALAVGAVNASTRLHSALLQRTLRAPMTFFDTTPIGRIVNRFAKDIDVVDATLPSTFRSWTSCLLQVISVVIVITISYPELIMVIIPLACFYYAIQKIFIVTTRQLKRLESITRSPMYSQFSETLSGVSVIRAYNCTNRFIDQSNKLVDTNQSCCYPNVIANRWLSTRLELFGNLMATCSALFAVWNRATVNAGVAGLTISFAMSVTQTLSWFVRMTSDLETNIVSVERIDEFVKLDVEDEWVKSNFRPPADWPDRGAIKIENFSTRYRKDTSIVLSKLFMNIRPREKIGIVGRTGSGKSSLSLALFRILEPVTGRIVIDNVDTKAIGLHDLRSKLTIIPQDPVLFSGTLRFNLDPLQLYTDEAIWRALDQAHLRTHINALSKGLDTKVAEYGENFSVGQRQLICLARALLRKTKILVLDEATAAVDLETDSLVLKTIRKEFQDCTVITIAHRLHTILESDRVLVLDKGCIREFDSPAVLLANSESLIHQFLCQNTMGETTEILENLEKDKGGHIIISGGGGGGGGYGGGGYPMPIAMPMPMFCGRGGGGGYGSGGGGGGYGGGGG